jgi:hypothetical protein
LKVLMRKPTFSPFYNLIIIKQMDHMNVIKQLANRSFSFKIVYEVQFEKNIIWSKEGIFGPGFYCRKGGLSLQVRPKYHTLHTVLKWTPPLCFLSKATFLSQANQLITTSLSSLPLQLKSSSFFCYFHKIRGVLDKGRFKVPFFGICHSI